MRRSAVIIETSSITHYTMSPLTYLVAATLALASIVEPARILIVIPTPSISHQVPMRRFTNELVRRGHQVVSITTDPEYAPGAAPANLTEIDTHDESYDIWRRIFLPKANGRVDHLEPQIHAAFTAMLEIFVHQLEMPEVQKVMYNDTFDLIIAEAWSRTPMFLSHFHKVPVIQISTFHGYFFNFDEIGGVIHPILYPHAPQILYDYSLWGRMQQFYTYCSVYYWLSKFEKTQDAALRKFAPDHPGLNALSNNVAMIFINVYPIWDSNRPVPPNVLYIGGIHQTIQKPLPKDLERYLNSSKHGVVYVSFGTNMNPSILPPSKIQAMINAFSRLPYDVMWKWDKDELPGKAKNIKIFKWMPQSDLLRHPKIKLFITQAGLQSTDEALTAGVPLLAIPMLGDQWYNAEKYVQLKIGRKLSIETFTETELYEEINEVIGNPSYKQNIISLKRQIHEQPDTPLNQAIWWIEHVLKHGGAHLRPPGANMSYWEYFQLDLVLILLSALALSIVTVVSIAIYLYRHISLRVKWKKE